MTLAERLGRFASEARLPADPAFADLLALHVADTVGALDAGAAVAESAVLPAAVRALGEGLGATVLRLCATVRCTELDDIHLAACVTPGAVVVPVVLAARRAERFANQRVLAACYAGYETAIRLGLAVDGPRLLARGIWPTALVAPLAAAATLASLLGLDPQRAAHALAIAATTAAGTSGRPAGLSARWFALGVAAQNGVAAALAARAGFHGEPQLLDGGWSRATGIALDVDRCAAGLGDEVLTRETSVKPWCAAKQTIAAIAAFRGLLDEHGGDPGRFTEIEVAVPAAQRAMIDRPEPRERLDAIASVQHRLACAAFAPDRLLDPAAGARTDDPAFAAFASRVRVVADPALEDRYPARWPARVAVVTADGTRREHTVVDAPGDPGTGFGWDEVAAKYGLEDADSLLAEAGIPGRLPYGG